VGGTGGGAVGELYNGERDGERVPPTARRLKGTGKGATSFSLNLKMAALPQGGTVIQNAVRKATEVEDWAKRWGFGEPGHG